MPVSDTAPPPTRAERLKRATNETHERLDQCIMGKGIFDSRALFACFLRVQHRLHARIDALYDDPALQAPFPELPSRRRLARIERDLADLGSAAPIDAPARAPLPAWPTALGWLYVVEGSALGGAVIYKMAARLGLDQQFGASHLAPPSHGVAAHWRHFTAALNALPLTDHEEQQVVAGARAAFSAVGHYVSEEFA